MIPCAYVGKTAIYRVDDALIYLSGFQVDGDGATTCYAPHDSGLPTLDNLKNALHHTDDDLIHPVYGWAGLICDHTGNPIIQGDTPDGHHAHATGYYLSGTSLQDHAFDDADPCRYVHADEVPYLTAAPELRALGVSFGDLGISFNRKSGILSPAVVADGCPHGKTGEGSIALASAIGLPSSARNGGCDSGIATIIFQGSGATGATWPAAFSDRAKALFLTWGNGERLTREIASTVK